MRMTRELGVGAVLFLLVGGLAVVEPRLLAADTFKILMLTIPLILVGAMGQLLVIVSRHVDISIGSVLALSAIVAGMAFRDIEGLPVWAGFLIGLSVGGLAGFVNALLVSALRLHSIIVTLGTLSIYRGLAFLVADNRQISAQELSADLLALAQADLAGLPYLTIGALAVVAAAHLALRYTGFGRQLYATGSNPEAAHLRGVRVKTVTTAAFTLAGACAGLAGVMYAARFGVVNPSSAGAGFELTVIAAVIVGGASIAGGVGSAPGVLIGVLLVGVIEVALPLLGIPRVWQDVLAGAIIVAALTADRLLRGGGVWRWRTG